MRLMNNASHILSICNLFQPFHFTCVLIIWEKKTGKSSNCGGSLEKNVVNGISFHFIAPSWAQSDGVVFATCARAPPPPCFRFGWIIMRFFSEYKSMVLLEKLFLKAKYHKRKHRAKKTIHSYQMIASFRLCLLFSRWLQKKSATECTMHLSDVTGRCNA